MYEPSMFFTEETGPGFDSGGGGNPVFGEESMPEDVRLLGSSEVGYSEIYRAKIDGKFVVLKSLKPELRGIPMYEHLLHKEYEIGYDLDHPNICQIQRFGKFIGLGNCIVMQWIDGVTLRSMLGHMDAGQERKVIDGICDALEYIHSKQIVHRDLKPENIIITHNGQNVKLIDFGLSDADWFAVLKIPAGTRRYAAPELIGGKAVDCRADIYSLGCILKEMSPRYRKVAEKCAAGSAAERYRDIREVRKALKVNDNARIWRIIEGVALVAVLAAVAVYLFSDGSSRVPDKVFREITEEIIEADK